MGNPLRENDLELLHEQVFFIGGGTCAGKTTLARARAREGGARVFSADDGHGAYAESAGRTGDVPLRRDGAVDFERMWSRSPDEQLEEMLSFYRDIFPYVLADLAAFVRAGAFGSSPASVPAAPCASACPSALADAFAPSVIAEGIAFLPSLLHGIGIPADHCVFLTAESGVHVERYAKRDWTHLMLEGCDNPARAFDLWMQRDELFAACVRAECAELGYPHLLIG